VLLVALSGCAQQKLIPNTKVQDSPINREILTVVERYRQAVERQDAASVLALVHPSYQDYAGTPQSNDDIDYNGLRKILTNRFKQASRIRYRIEYQEVRGAGETAQVDTYIDATFIYEEPNANPRWRRLTDYNQFRLMKNGLTWRFVGGL